MDILSVVQETLAGGGMLVPIIASAISVMLWVINLFLFWKVIYMVEGNISIVTRILSIFVPFYINIRTAKSIQCKTLPWFVGIAGMFIGIIITVLGVLEIGPALLVAVGAGLASAGILFLSVLILKLYVDIVYIAEFSTWYIMLIFFCNPVAIVLMFIKLKPQ